MTLDSTPPVSARRSLRQSGTPEFRIVEGLRSYQDDPSLERVWKRLESSRNRASAPPIKSALRSAALVAAGVLFGMWYQTQRAPKLVATAESRVTSHSVPAAPSDALEPRTSRRPVQSPAELGDAARRRVQRYGAPRRVAPSPAPTKDRSVAEEPTVQDLTHLPELGPEPILPPVRPRWLLLADRGDFAGAFQQLDESNGFERVLKSGSADELMTLVDVARSMGRQGRAIQALRVVVERHRTDPNAPLAAMMLGNLLSRAGDQQGAARAFALNRRLAPGGDFAEDALVREFDMAVASKQLSRSLSLADQYDDEFPQGRQGDQLRLDIARLAEELVATSSSDAATQTDEESTQEGPPQGADSSPAASKPREKTEAWSEVDADRSGPESTESAERSGSSGSTEPSSTEPSRKEPSGTEPSRKEPSGTEPSRKEPSGTGDSDSTDGETPEDPEASGSVNYSKE